MRGHTLLASVHLLFATGSAAPLLSGRIANLGNISSLVVFGDSYSDNGNEYRLSGQKWPADPAYYQGRFSNGLEWNEHLAQTLRLPLHNYAYGGATTSNALVQGYSGNGSTLPVPSLEEQVNTYLQDTPSEAPPATSLFALLGGANDLLFNPNLTAVQSVGVISGLITTLRNRGARNFLLLNYPDLGALPYDFYIPSATQQQLHNFSVELGTQLGSLRNSIADSGTAPTAPTTSTPVTAYYADLVPLFESFGYYQGGWRDVGLDQLGLYGSCLTGAYVEVPQRTLCDDPDKHVFWDEYHPTRVAHQIIADEVQKVLGVSG